MSGITTERWFVDGDFRPGMEWNRHIMRDKNTAVCFMAHSAGRTPEGDAARAKLIAAAPQLAEALRDCLAYLENDLSGPDNSRPEREQALAALSAAGLEPKP